MRDLQVVSYNVNRLGDDWKRRNIFNCMRKNTSGKAVVFLQETHSVQKVKQLFEYQWRGKVLFSQGICILCAMYLERAWELNNY